MTKIFWWPKQLGTSLLTHALLVRYSSERIGLKLRMALIELGPKE